MLVAVALSAGAPVVLTREPLLVIPAVGGTVATGILARRRFGGITGDVLNAATELCELAGLMTAVALA